jgi:membrane associated rhomboid family serine protease
VAWQDRDYSEESYGEAVSTSRGVRRPPNATLSLMLLHGAAFVLLFMLQHTEGEGIAALLALEGATTNPVGILLHPLATTEVLQAVFVVLALWSLGGRLEPRLGVRHFIGLYLTGNVAAGLVYFGLARGLPGLATAPLNYPVGALAGFCVAAWRGLQHDQVQVLGRVTNTAKVYAVCAGLVIALVVIGARGGAVVWLAAAAAGGGSTLLLEHWPALRGRRRPRARRAVQPSIPRSIAQPPLEEPDIDDILAKIGRSGLSSLTDAERNCLEAARQAKLRRARKSHPRPPSAHTQEQ